MGPYNVGYVPDITQFVSNSTHVAQRIHYVKLPESVMGDQFWSPLYEESEAVGSLWPASYRRQFKKTQEALRRVGDSLSSYIRGEINKRKGKRNPKHPVIRG